MTLDVNFRPELSRRLDQCLDAFQDGFRHNLALIGPPGAGKSFQIQQALARPRPLLMVSCALYRESCRSFLARLIGTILQAGLPVEGGGTASLEALLQEAQSKLPATAAVLEQARGLLARRACTEAFTRALDAIPVLSGEQRRPVVLALDEFLYLEDLGLPHAFHELGKRVMTWPHTLFLLSSSSPFRARTILRERLQLLFGHFEILALDSPEPAAADAWTCRQLQRLDGSKDTVPFLLHWLGGSPWYLTAFVHRLRELATLRGAARLTEPLFFETAWDLLGHPAGALHQWCAARVGRLSGRAGAKATEALVAIADGARTQTEVGKRIGRAGLSSALQTLVAQDLVHRQGACWFVPDPVFRCWLTTVLAEQRLGLDSDPAAQRARFERHLSGVWTRWLRTMELSGSEQLVDLLGRFQDDTVALDSKIGRLPKFERITAHPEGRAAGASYVVAEGPGKRWCCAVHERQVDEAAVARFEAFCRTQSPKPSRKIVVARCGVEDNARLLAKAHHMWVWQAEELRVLTELYGQAPQKGGPAPAMVGRA